MKIYHFIQQSIYIIFCQRIIKFYCDVTNSSSIALWSPCSVVLNFVLMKIILRWFCVPGDGEELDLDQRPLVMQRGRLDPHHYYFELRKKEGEEADDTVSNK